MEQELEQIEGTVEDIIYENTDNVLVRRFSNWNT